MYNNLDASKFSGSISFYILNFEDILSKITVCYHKMIIDYSIIENNENAIRDILLLRYLKNDKIREEVGLIDLYNFEREVQEDDTVGRTDIKITTRDTFKKQEAYYTIECKRLDSKAAKGTSGLNAKYISDGIYRFTSRHYSSFYRVNAMIGFIVENIDINQNTENINILLEKKTVINTTQKITKSNFIKDFEYHYHSEHIDKDNQQLKIYHLMFDLSSCIH